MKNSYSHELVGNEVVSIIHGSDVVNFDKPSFESFIFDKMKESFDISTLSGYFESYANAFHWLFANLYRTAGIQIYDDEEIRLNIIPSQIVDDKKCLLLKQDDIENREFDIVVHAFLFECIYSLPQVATKFDS